MVGVLYLTAVEGLRPAAVVDRAGDGMVGGVFRGGVAGELDGPGPIMGSYSHGQWASHCWIICRTITGLYLLELNLLAVGFYLVAVSAVLDPGL